jgi:hypothetical protein
MGFPEHISDGYIISEDILLVVVSFSDYYRTPISVYEANPLAFDVFALNSQYGIRDSHTCIR